MKTILYILGSGILEHPARWEILGIAVTGMLFFVVTCWTVWICLNDLHPVSNRNCKCVLGAIVMLLLMYIFGLFSDRYNEIMYKATEVNKTIVPSSISWSFQQDGRGNVLIYENMNIK